MVSSLLAEFPIVLQVGPEDRHVVVTGRPCRQCEKDRWTRGVGVERNPYLRCVGCGWTRPDDITVEFFLPAGSSRPARNRKRTFYK